MTIGPIGTAAVAVLAERPLLRELLGPARREIVEHRVAHHARGGPLGIDVRQALADDRRDLAFPVEAALVRVDRRGRAAHRQRRGPAAENRRVLRDLELAFRRVRAVVEPDADDPRRRRHRRRQARPRSAAASPLRQPPRASLEMTPRTSE